MNSNLAIYQPPAKQRDELLQVALDFISNLTGMTPPPIEVAPPGVFAPFYAFVERVQEVVAAHPAPNAVTLPTTRANRVYISGPMTGLPDLNFPAFNAAAVDLQKKGFTVINPADHGVVPGAQWGDYLRADLAALAACETIYLLPGWSQSKGAKLEVHAAKELGMQLTYAPGAETAQQGLDALTQAVRDVISERHRQVSLGYDQAHDDEHCCEEIAAAAAVLLMPEVCRDWDATSTTYGNTLAEAVLPRDWGVPDFGDDRRVQLVKGAAMAIAEIERFDRSAAQEKQGGV